MTSTTTAKITWILLPWILDSLAGFDSEMQRAGVVIHDSDLIFIRDGLNTILVRHVFSRKR